MSANHPHKDYRDVHERYAAVGARELVVFDPFLLGPAFLGGPTTFQLWRTDECGAFERIATGDGPVFSEVLGCWLSSAGRELVFSADRAGTERRRSREESALLEKERTLADKERALADKERERAEKEEALERVKELERRLGKTSG